MNTKPNTQPREQRVFREVSFPVSTFDKLKAAQRHFASQGRTLNNNDVLAVMIGMAFEQLEKVENLNDDRNGHAQHE